MRYWGQTRRAACVIRAIVALSSGNNFKEREAVVLRVCFLLLVRTENASLHDAHHHSIDVTAISSFGITNGPSKLIFWVGTMCRKSM